MLHAVRHLHSFERFNDSPFSLPCRHSPICQRQFNIFVNRKVADEIESLKDETDFAIAHACTIVIRQFLHGPPIQQVASFCRRIEQSQNREQRGFTAAGRTGHKEVTTDSVWDSIVVRAWFSTPSLENIRLTRSSLITVSSIPTGVIRSATIRWDPRVWPVVLESGTLPAK